MATATYPLASARGSGFGTARIVQAFAYNPSMVTFGTNRFAFPDPERLAASASEAEDAGFSYLWFPDSQLRTGDVFLNVLTALRATKSAFAGTLLVNPVTRHPSVLASSAATVDLYAPGRFLLGIGTGDTSVHQVGLHPARLAGLESAARTIRALLAGDGVDLGWTQPSIMTPARPVPVIVAGSGPRTLRMAGRYADGVVIRLGTDPDLISWAYDEFRRGARESGRDPATLFVAGHFHTVISEDPDVVTRRARVLAAGYYEVNRGLWERLGMAWPCAPMEQLLERVRPDFHHAFDMDLAADAVAEIPLADALRFCLAGDGPAVREQLRAITTRFPWMKHVILQPNMPGSRFIAACATDIIPALANA